VDTDEELAKFKWVLFCLVAFLFSTYYSIREFKFFLFGETASATVTRTFETRTVRTRGPGTQVLAVEYTFTTTAGEQLSERDDIPIDWPVPEGTVEIEYVPGSANSSRIVGNRRLLPVWIFFGTLCFLGYSGFQLYKEANEPVRPRRMRG
jgi:hypothetical protein